MVATKSKWTSFIEPQDSEEVHVYKYYIIVSDITSLLHHRLQDSETNPERLYTMDKETFKNSHAKKKVRR